MCVFLLIMWNKLLLYYYYYYYYYYYWIVLHSVQLLLLTDHKYIDLNKPSFVKISRYPFYSYLIVFNRTGLHLILFHQNSLPMKNL